MRKQALGGVDGSAILGCIDAGGVMRTIRELREEARERIATGRAAGIASVSISVSFQIPEGSEYGALCIEASKRLVGADDPMPLWSLRVDLDRPVPGFASKFFPDATLRCDPSEVTDAVVEFGSALCTHAGADAMDWRRQPEAP